jgi:hypothetical protein
VSYYPGDFITYLDLQSVQDTISGASREVKPRVEIINGQFVLIATSPILITPPGSWLVLSVHNEAPHAWGIVRVKNGGLVDPRFEAVIAAHEGKYYIATTCPHNINIGHYSSFTIVDTVSRSDGQGYVDGMYMTFEEAMNVMRRIKTSGLAIQRG